MDKSNGVFKDRLPEEKSVEHQIGKSPSIADFSKDGLLSIMELIKGINSLPSGASRDAYCAYSSFGKTIDKQSDRILEIISKVLKDKHIKGNIQRRQQDEQFEMLLECNDYMLERINSNLDEMAGIKKNPQTIFVESKITNIGSSSNIGAGSWNIKKTDVTNTSARLIAAKNIPRPQINFKDQIDNSAHTPFEPRLKDKPNSLKPLAILPEYDEFGNIESYLHPYEFELDKFQPTNNQLKLVTSIEQPKPMDQTKLVYVDNEKVLKRVINELKSATEIAVDLEHHSYRTFQGITCLMQISTIEVDYIFDTLKLREDMHILNEVFTNSKILKIFHGADCDIQWLQRDLSLYIVNMFDTHQAAKILGFPRLSLAFLLKKYCNIDADKTFQLADWRIRPLPQELILYARQDTHFLNFIYKSLCNELLEHSNSPNLLKTVFDRSTEICKKRYFKPKIHETSHVELYRKSKRNFDNRQVFALREIFEWRDKIARQEDESYGYVLPNHMMLQIAESLPREMQGILACCNPIPPLVRQYLHKLHQIILKAREQPLIKPIISEQIVNRLIIPSNKDYNSKLYCPHDFSHDSEFRDDLPTLLGENYKTETFRSNLVLAKPVLQIFELNPRLEDDIVKAKLEDLRNFKFASPYERYKAVIPFSEKQKLAEIMQQKEDDKSKILCPIKKEIDLDNIEITTVEEDPYSLPLKESLKRKRNDDDVKLPDSKKSKSVEVSENTKTKSVNIKIENSSDVSEIDKTNFDKKKKLNSKAQEPSSSLTNSEEPTTFLQKNANKKKKGKYKKTDYKNDRFDYTKVDYKQFQGGAQKAKGVAIQAKLHGKGKKGNNKKFNKLFTFDTNKKKK